MKNISKKRKAAETIVGATIGAAIAGPAGAVAGGLIGSQVAAHTAHPEEPTNSSDAATATTTGKSSQESKIDLAAIRTEYRRGKLHRADLDVDPIRQFNQWLKEACDAGLKEPTAMSLATVGADGAPLLRTVLLKGLDERGFVFFTNLESRKARHIAANPHVSLLFAWLPLERQVVITGEAAMLSSAEALGYFLSRPRESQVAAWASRQSSVISSRKLLEMEWEHLKAKFSAGQVPLPSFWGGYRVSPRTIEFWQGRPNRLHDRFEYSRKSNGPWALDRLAP